MIIKTTHLDSLVLWLLCALLPPNKACTVCSVLTQLLIVVLLLERKIVDKEDEQNDSIKVCSEISLQF